MRCRDAKIWRLNLLQLLYNKNNRNETKKTLVMEITFSMNCVLESMRKSLKTECRQLSVALVSLIRLSSCFSISCVFESILWEKSWRKRKSYEAKKKKRNCEKSISCTNTISNAHFIMLAMTGCLRKRCCELLSFSSNFYLWEEFLTYPWVGC